MSLEAKLIVFAGALAVLLPLMLIVLRRVRRGARFGKAKLGSMSTPPTGPTIDGGC